MCRHLAYLGPPVDLASLLLAPPHSLVDQAQAARFQDSGTKNPDGFGVGWYAVDAHMNSPEGAPQRYRTAEPIWDDVEFAALAPSATATAALAAVRLASPGAPVEVSGNAPFVSGPWLFSLNGVVHHHFDGVGTALRAGVSPRRGAAIEGVTDSELLFAMALDRMDAGATPAEALAATVAAVTARTTGKLNLLLTDGHRIAATAWSNSLFTRTDRSGAGPSTLVASEPLDDDPAWVRVPDRALVTADDTGAYAVTAL